MGCGIAQKRARRRGIGGLTGVGPAWTAFAIRVSNGAHPATFHPPVNIFGAG